MGQASSRRGKDRQDWVPFRRTGRPCPLLLLGITNGTSAKWFPGDLREGAEVIVEELTKKKTQGIAGGSPGVRGLGEVAQNVIRSVVLHVS